MSFRRLLEKIEARPHEYLDSVDLLSLGAFLSGCKMVDDRALVALQELNRRIEGPGGADACTRAYLGSDPRHTGFQAILEVLKDIEAELQAGAGANDVPGHRILELQALVDFVRTPIESGRVGMVFSEPTVLWMTNYIHGFLAGLENVAPSRALEARNLLAEFERWLRLRYGQPQARWYAILRVYEGATRSGLEGFVKRWDEFVAFRAGRDLS